MVSRVITEADGPAAEPKNSSIAGTKSPEDRPCRYSSGSTSATFELFRHHGGRISDRKRTRSPVAGSTRLSLTRGAATSITQPRWSPTAAGERCTCASAPGIVAM
jgi:hypothetical protein